jgi:hypothetical protein
LFLIKLALSLPLSEKEEDAEPARGAFLLAERDTFTTRRALAIRRAMKVESQDKAGKQERKGRKGGRGPEKEGARA